MPVNHRHFVHPPGGDHGSHSHEPFMPEFVDHGMITHRAAINGGFWDRGTTWDTGVVPAEGSHVLLDGRRVVCRGDVRLDSLMAVNGGGISLDPEEDVTLICSGLRSGLQFIGGHFEDGSPDNPVQSNRRHVVRFEGGVDRAWDPGSYSNSLVVWGGKTTVHGFAVARTWGWLTKEAMAGDTALVVDGSFGWLPGDKIVIPDSRQVPTTKDIFDDPHWEESEVDRCEGNKVYLRSPLMFDHFAGRHPDTGEVLYPFVLRLSSNVVFESPAGRTGDPRGHMMCTGRAAVDWRYCEIRHMGRTTTEELDSTTFDAEGNPTHVGANPKGRYPFHLHHCIGPVGGVPSAGGRQFLMRGISVWDSPKWAWSVHGSHYGDVDGCVGYDCSGAIFVLEDGNESGVHLTNTAGCVSRGTRSNGQRAGGDENDFGHGGDIFWIPGLHECVLKHLAGANGMSDGFNLYGFGHKLMRIPTHQGADPHAEGGYRADYTPERKYTVPQEVSDLNLFSCDRSFFNWGFRADVFPIDRPRFWHSRESAVRTAYHGGIWLRDGLLLADQSIFGRDEYGTLDWGIQSSEPENLKLENIAIVGFHSGIVAPGLCNITWTGVGFNLHDVYLRTDGAWPGGSGGTHRIEADLRGPVKVYKQFWLSPTRTGRTDFFAPEKTYVKLPDGRTVQVFYPEQAPDFVLPAVVSPSPGLTNAQLVATGKPCFAGELLPEGGADLEGFAAKVVVTDVVPPPPPADTTSPTITGLQLGDVTETGAVVTWQTDEPTFGAASYFAAGSPDVTETPYGETVGLDHRAVLTDLAPETWYEVTAKAKDVAGNESRAAVGFQTLPVKGGSKMVISNAEAVVRRAAGCNFSLVTVSWDVDVPASGQAGFGMMNGPVTPGEHFPASWARSLEEAGPQTSFIVNFLAPAAGTYHWKVVSAAAGESPAAVGTFTVP